jgi:homocysteine S-methyltransferase
MTPLDELDLTGLRVIDGGLATELEHAGCDLASPLWSGEVLRTHPEKVLAVHRSYLDAGADFVRSGSTGMARALRSSRASRWAKRHGENTCRPS